MLSHIKDNNNLWTVVIDGKPFQFDSKHPEYDSLVECVKVGDADEFVQIIEVGTVIEDWSEGNFNLREGMLYYGDEQVADQPTERILALIKQGWDHTPMLRYLDNLYQNVSNRAVQESYNWCMHKGLPITDDGMMIGYKGVSVYRGEERKDKLGQTLKEGDLVDRYTLKSFRNNPGDKPSMVRRQVSDNCNEGCAAGLHVGTYEYASNWAGNDGKVVLVKFNPADIVSVPTDCQFQKMRVCKYEVISVARDILEQEVYVTPDDEDYDEDYEEDYDDLYYDDDEDEDDFGL
jgi:hypothetical protein